MSTTGDTNILQKEQIKDAAGLEEELKNMLNISTPSDILSIFFNTQGQRAAIYTKWNQGFRVYLDTQNEEEYTKLCQTVSSLISKVSKELIMIEAALQPIKPKWSTIINELRDYEKVKFILTSKYQILKTEVHANDSMTRIDEDGNIIKMENDGCFKEHIQGCNQQLQECQTTLNQITSMINEKLEDLQYELNEEEDAKGTPDRSNKDTHNNEHKHEHSHTCNH
ncbi:hypothetical protein DFA_08940 [Cavenderia fasciculata]|uniref:Uncharacterized protein n=1 Tax=Cavenderia fasciculata TaxID=261658 RepID=F4Q546_CACFS|nr:uncharacterized protein DFA_08940 [Cavenderia fasciculata]EGG17939.1 hypothetical protein DFA_08940 [Cavenderia fasciculata]|eukprot:XP_004356423.1 hypothetical protein DFA_08940 [Cavenderia fasciculata]